MSETKKEYDVFKGLLNNEQVYTLHSEQVLSCVQQYTCSQLGSNSVQYVLHDGCDVRKPDSKAMEYVGKVLSLSKQVINGYKTMNSVVVNADNQTLSLLCHELYSTEMDNYVGQALLDDPEMMSKLTPTQKTALESGEHINTKILYKKNLAKSSHLIKQSQPLAEVCHISDREFDDEDLFEYIDTDLHDTFVGRLKGNRVSHEVFFTTTPKGKISKTPKQYKLIDKKFQNTHIRQIPVINIKGTKHFNVDLKTEWEPLIINHKTYTVVRITLSKQGEPIFDQPMLLITNKTIKNDTQAIQIYYNYILRFKIEVVFRFLKQNLGWEDFQVRDFNSIKNLLAIAFFLVGYFPELEDELRKHHLAAELCSLAKSKGKITIHFLIQGLQMVAHFQIVQQWINQNDIQQHQIDELLNLFSSHKTT
jgi:Transposase DDE domain